MHTIDPAPKREPNIYLHCRGVGTRVFCGLDHLCSEITLGFIGIHVGNTYYDEIKIVTTRASGGYWDKGRRAISYRHPEQYYWKPAEYIIRTEDGQRLTAEYLRPVYWEWRSRQRRPWRDRHGRKASKVYGNWRSPKTTNERRQAFQNVDEGEPPIRARRNKTNLINAWDDTITHNDASWKTQSKRRHQYRPK